MTASPSIRRILVVAAVTEALTGLFLLAFPSVFVDLLLNAEIAGAGIVAARIAGMAILSLAAACWPARIVPAVVVGMFGYNLLVAVYLIAIALQGEMVGVLLWPAAVYHTAVVVAMCVAARSTRNGAK